jgi:hypothetical protein
MSFKGGVWLLISNDYKLQDYAKSNPLRKNVGSNCSTHLAPSEQMSNFLVEDLECLLNISI